MQLIKINFRPNSEIQNQLNVKAKKKEIQKDVSPNSFMSIQWMRAHNNQALASVQKKIK